MTRPITTAPADTARAMHAAEMRGPDMQDAPDDMPKLTMHYPVHPPLPIRAFEIRHCSAGPYAVMRNDLITEAECQRRVDAAVAAEREACEAEVRRQFRIWEDFGASGFDDLCMAIIPEAIRARGQK